MKCPAQSIKNKGRMECMHEWMNEWMVQACIHDCLIWPTDWLMDREMDRKIGGWTDRSLIDGWADWQRDGPSDSNWLTEWMDERKKSQKKELRKEWINKTINKLKSKGMILTCVQDSIWTSTGRCSHKFRYCEGQFLQNMIKYLKLVSRSTRRPI